MEWLIYAGFIAVTVIFVALELVALLLKTGAATVSTNLWRLQRQYGWWVRGPLLAAWLLLGSHLLLHIPA